MSQPFRELGRRLYAAGVADGAIRRYLTELAEHRSDLIQEGIHAGKGRSEAEAVATERLGDIDTLVRAMATRPELQSWTSKAPWAAYWLAPAAGMVGALVLGVLVLMATTQMFPSGATGHHLLPNWFGAFAQGVCLFETVIVPLVIGWWIAILACRRQAGWWWPVLGLVCLAAIGGGAELSVQLPTVTGGPGEINVGFALLPPFTNLGATILQIAVDLILTAGPYIFWRNLHEGIRLADDAR